MKRSSLRSRLLALSITLGCVLLAAGGLAISKPEGTSEGQSFQIVKGTLGQPVSINEGEVLVSRLRVGRALTQNGEVKSRTAGMFVVVTVVGSASGPSSIKLGSFRLLSKKRVYLPYSVLISVNAEPGFQSSVDLAFEVDPKRIDDLMLEAWGTEVLVGYHQRVRVPLGITTRNAQRWRDAAPSQILETRPFSETRVIP